MKRGSTSPAPPRGYALRLRFHSELTGPCVRCLEDATTKLEIDAREVDQPPADDEELRSPYVSEGDLDLDRWANDALVLALPSQPLCRPDCAGLCPVCGESLNEADPEAHRHRQGGDPRMAKLKDLKLEELPSRAMAVPKKRQSRARRDKRRAQHKVSAPRLNECPRCHSPRLPHRVCPTCGTYAGREVIRHEEPETAAPSAGQASPQD